MKSKSIHLFLSGLLCAIALTSCGTIPKGVKAVDDFEKNKYLGKWYEIARIDFSFERNLNNTTAEYSIRPDGKIKVVNRGFNTKKEKWEDAVGKARFVGDERVGQLQVSFFGPFYAGYNVLAIDENYQYALVGGDDFKYLWLLSRQKTMPEAVKNDYVNKAKSIGYHAEDLIWVAHDKE